MATRPTDPDGAVEARAFEAEDEPGVLELLRTAFAGWPREIEGLTPSEFFRWKHLEAPSGPSVMVVAESRGAIVGFAGYLRWKLSAGGRVVSTMRGADFAVHPSYRRRGVSMAMRAAATFPGNAAFTWSNPNEQSRPGGLSWGQREVRIQPYFVRPGQLRATLQRRLAKGSRSSQRLSIEADTAAEVLRDGARVSPLLTRTGDSGDRLKTAKDIAHLRWRYGQLAEYHAVRADTGAGGLAIFRTRQHGRFWVSHICELLAGEDDHRTVHHLIGRVRAAAPADLITCSFSSHLSAGRYGFVRHPREQVMMVYPLELNLAPDPTRRASWALSLGDLDLL